MDYKALYEKWTGSGILSGDEKAELKALKADEKELKERFAAELEFGTAGMRGVIGVGPNRMNRFVVARATRGMCGYVKGLGRERDGVVISYDTRRFSAEFAIICAEVLSEHGINAILYENVRPVPMLSFAVRECGAAAGIMITASHNTKEYNGYKVYGADGAQMSPEDTGKVVRFIAAEREYLVPVKSLGLTPGNIRGKDGERVGNVTIVGKSLDEKYYEAVSALELSPDDVRKTAGKIKIVYTPLHGSGYVPVTTMLGRMGVSVITVPEQTAPDGDFPTVKAPNPENADALSMAVRLATETGADAVIGTDPDCDRMGAAVRDENGNFVLLTGNRIGVLLCDYVLRRNAERGTLPADSAIVKTIVSTKLADKVAAGYGAEVFDVLTGFKYIGEKIREWEESGEHTFMFGFEESYGSLSGTHARDKDAVVASMLFAELVCHEAAAGGSVYGRLRSIFDRYGCFAERSASFAFKGLDGMDRMRAVMDKVRLLSPRKIGGDAVLQTSDYESGRTVSADGSVRDTGLPESNVVKYTLENDGWVCVRPSGTEPKLKVYIGAAAKDEETAAAKSKRYLEAATALLGLS